MRWLRGFCAGVLVVCAWGCSDHFDVLVTNRLQEPVTIWLTKWHGPYERGWEPPELRAVATTTEQPLGGVIIRPGETARTSRDGHIGSDNQAILRVYRATDFNAALAMNKGDPGRLDIPLLPGTTDIDLVLRNGLIVDRPHRPGTRPAG